MSDKDQHNDEEPKKTDIDIGSISEQSGGQANIAGGDIHIHIHNPATPPELSETHKKIFGSQVIMKDVEIWVKDFRNKGERPDLSGSNLTDVIMPEIDLHDVLFIRADLTKAHLSEANLSKADLSDTDLSKADLRAANLSAADLRGANLSGANLHKADLRAAKLFGAKLLEADLRAANLTGANLFGADLREADLRDANLQAANLQGANLRDAKVTDTQLAATGRLRSATMPDGSRYDGRFELEGDIESARELGIDTNDANALGGWYAAE